MLNQRYFYLNRAMQLSVLPSSPLFLDNPQRFHFDSMAAELQNDPNFDSKSEPRMLNPMAEEFVPSSPVLFHSMRNNGILGTRLWRAFRALSIKRTVYVSDIDHNVSEDQLGAIFSAYGHVLDCRICAEPRSHFRYGFVEYGDEDSARAALNLCGAVLGFSRIGVFPSKTAIFPVNPSLLPQSEDDVEMCARTVYCTNIDKKVSRAVFKCFFETRCGKVSRLRLLGDRAHPTRIAFIEFVSVESAMMALHCSRELLGSLHIRVSPSRTPVRPRGGRQLSVTHQDQML